MSADQRLVCPQCEAINRVAIARLGDAPICGACKHSLFDSQPLTLTIRNFDRHIAKTDWPVLVDFWAPWCGPCKAMTPVIQEAARQLRTRMRVAKLNTETEGEVAARFGIRSIPTLMVFHHGEIVKRHAGAIDLDRLMAWATADLA